MGELIQFPDKKTGENQMSEYDRLFETKVVKDIAQSGDPSAQADAADFRRMLIVLKNTKQT